MPALRRRGVPRAEGRAEGEGLEHGRRRRGRVRAGSWARTRRRSQTIAEAVEKAGYTLGRDIYLGLDVASSEFFSDGAYTLESEQRKFSSDEFADFLEDLVARYPIVSIEDGMAENDWDGWAT